MIISLDCLVPLLGGVACSLFEFFQENLLSISGGGNDCIGMVIGTYTLSGD